MERLHIPLGSSTQTTRRSRRVVSQIVLGGIALLCLWILTSTWFARNTTARTLPTETVLAVRLLPTASTWPILEEHLRGIPLISNRSLTIADIKPWVQGELTWFFLKDGTRGLALRANPKTLPQAWLDAQGILVTSPTSHVMILSDRVLPLIKIPNPHWTGWRFLLPWPHPLGQIFVATDPSWISGTVYADLTSVSVYTKKVWGGQTALRTIPDSVFASISVPSQVSSLPLVSMVDRYLQYTSPTTLTSLLTSGKLTPQTVWLDQEEGTQVGYLMVFDGSGVSEEEASALVRASIALRSPISRSWILPDRSLAKELIVDPSLITLSSTTIAGVKTIQASLNPQESVILALPPGQLIISNKETLVDFWLNMAKKERSSNPCFGSILSLDLAKALRTSENATLSIHPSLTQSFVNNLSKVGIKNGIFHSKIRLCK